MPQTGIVYLVGAGPGDPGLLTLRGRECLEQADLVLYDGLANPLLLQHTHARTERTSRVSGPGGRRLDQDEIKERLIAAAREGKTVVRLKGGDPFIFGRGAEEAIALAEAGIPFEVVPGITAATAAGVYAGFSFTHRELSSAVAFVTGHEDPGKENSALNYSVLARFPGTLVFYMGLHRLGKIAAELMAAGLDPTTPAAVISRASTPAQRVVMAPLCELQAEAERAQLSPPSLIVIGRCIEQRESIRWFECRTLFGRRIGITRPELQCQEAVHATLDRGAQPVLLPTMRILPPEDWSPVDQLIGQLRAYDWLVFTSVNGVDALLGRLWEKGHDVRRLGHLKIAAIGPSTAERLERYSLRADLVPNVYRAEELADRLREHAAGAHVVWARANRGRDVLPRELRAVGCQVDEVVVYQHHDLEAWPADVTGQLDAGQLDWVGLSSPAIARRFAAMISNQARQHLGHATRIAAISPVTAAAAAESGLPVAVVASEHTWTGILDAVEAFEAASPSRQCDSPKRVPT